MLSAQKFIDLHGMDYKSIAIEDEVDTYIAEMEAGLLLQGSSLLMAPSYVEAKSDVAKNEPVICIDAGGTNFRIGVAGFNSDGKYFMDRVERFFMPGVERSLQAREFFRVLAQIIEPYLAYSQKIVMSFAYRAKSTESADMEIMVMTKEVKVLGAEGMLLGREIKKELAAMGHGGVEIIVINDTVACALSGKAEFLNEDYGAFTGTILGTGSNSCYIEKNANIDVVGRKEGCMAVNLEAGNYNKFPRTDIDRAFDESTMFPGVGLAEKMSSGGYMGAICDFILKYAERENVFEATRFCEIEKLSSESVNEFLENGSGILLAFGAAAEDGEKARYILENMVLRAARLVAVQMAAIAIKSPKANERVLMAVEGSLYENMYGLKQELKKTLVSYLKSKGISAALETIDHAVLKGCAIAGLGR